MSDSGENPFLIMPPPGVTPAPAAEPEVVEPLNEATALISLPPGVETVTYKMTPSRGVEPTEAPVASPKFFPTPGTAILPSAPPAEVPTPPAPGPEAEPPRTPQPRLTETATPLAPVAPGSAAPSSASAPPAASAPPVPPAAVVASAPQAPPATAVAPPIEQPEAAPAVAPAAPAPTAAPAAAPVYQPEPVSAAEVTQVPPPQAVGPQWRLLMPHGDAPVVLAGALVIGRSPVTIPEYSQAQLVKASDPSRSVSKTHALLGIDATGLWVADLGSTNGTFVITPTGGDVKVQPGAPVYVPSGSDIELGQYVIQVEQY